ncbi:MAG: hypothetical protein CW691_08490 [Candidatus Bathyarchaeum sp.]|nr:MAG: hypothetical protein CW691_08490 [Candidatus Bathyarchaeum sp.]
MQHKKPYVPILLFVALLTIVETTVLFPRTNVLSVSAVETSNSVQAYWDTTCQNTVHSLDWGNNFAGQTQNFNIYLRNEGDSSIVLDLTTENWLPQTAEQTIKLSWDYNGYSIHKNQVKPIQLALSISPETTGVTNFSFDIIIGCKECTRDVYQVAGEQILDAPANTVYFIYTDPLFQNRAESTYDCTSGETIRNLCANTQHYGFNTAQHWLLPSGAINTTTIHNSTIALFGGKFANKVVNYYETVKELTPVKIKIDNNNLFFENRADAIIGELPLSIIDNPKYCEDMFTVMAFYDKVGDNAFFVMYGVGWKGTWASGIYFKEVISKNLNEYTNGYYVFHWLDENELDGIPQSHEIHQENAN